MKRISITIAIFMIILSLVGCATTDITESHNNAPGTIVPEYSGAQLIYSSDKELIYTTGDAGDKVNELYKDHDELNRAPGSGVIDKYFDYLTHTPDLMRRAALADEDEREEKLKEAKEYIKKVGGLTRVTIFDAKVDAEFRENNIGTFFADRGLELPTDKTIIILHFAQQEL